MHADLVKEIQSGSSKALARAISFVENEQPGFEDILKGSTSKKTAKIIGITGPPGAGKSTLTDALIGEFLKNNAKVAVLCVDPSSPFNMGAVLGDRIRMSEWYTHPNVFIRSLATRGSMGGLHPKIFDILDVVQFAGFTHVLVETVGVGQSEIEIAGLADITIVVLVPESGDEVQTMKAGLMEIADIFVINKSDRPDADIFEKNLRLLLAPAFKRHAGDIPIIKTVGTEKKGVPALMNAILAIHDTSLNEERQISLITEKAWQLLIRKKMQNVDRRVLEQSIRNNYKQKDFNLYNLIEAL